MSADLSRQIDKNRDRLQTRMEDDAQDRRERKRFMSITRKTARGDRVKRWPSAERVLSQIEDVDEAMRELYDEAQARLLSDQSMAEQASPKASRFPALGGK